MKMHFFVHQRERRLGERSCCDLSVLNMFKMSAIFLYMCAALIKYMQNYRDVEVETKACWSVLMLLTSMLHKEYFRKQKSKSKLGFSCAVKQS